ncbi:hypothetical protein AWC13_12110 [Mycobacterium kubicae]|nr:hypothetical protein AWC13_12110 [Mycobacterium kubicae]
MVKPAQLTTPWKTHGRSLPLRQRSGERVEVGDVDLAEVDGSPRQLVTGAAIHVDHGEALCASGITGSTRARPMPWAPPMMSSFLPASISGA